MDIIDWNEAEVSETADFSAIGELARKGMDELVGGAIAYPRHWAGWTIETPSAVVLRLTPGRLFKNEVIYAAPQAIDLNVQTHLPVVPGDTKWIALLPRGTTPTEDAGRLVETDAATEQTVMVQVPKYKRRGVEIIVQDGVAGPTPQKPTVADTECCLGYVLLSVSGIQTIVPGEQWRVKPLYEVEGRLAGVELLLADTIRRTSALETALSDLYAKLKTIPRAEKIEQHDRDIARLSRLADLPDEARGYWYDPGLISDEWDKAHPSWLARIHEGIRFSYANERDARIELYNPADPNVVVVEGVCLPPFTEVARIAVEGAPDGFKNISQLVHQTTTAVQRSIARSRVDYGPTVEVCNNRSEYATIGQKAVGELFAVNGETFQNLGEITPTNTAINPASLQVQQDGSGVVRTIEGIYAWNAAAPAGPDHIAYAARQVIMTSWTETYWDYVTETFGVNGSRYAQNFLVPTTMIAPSIELFFSRVAQEGDVHLMLCETDATLLPNLDKVLARSSLTPQQISQGWTRFPFRPTLLDAGKWYAWVVVTTGNHAIGFVGNNNPDNAAANKYAQGAMLWYTGGWTQGSVGEDFLFRVNGAKFTTIRTVVEFQPLTLENGMTEFTLKYAGWAPDLTRLVWQIQPSGETEWFDLKPYNANPLNGLPALCRLRGTFIGTTDLMPCIVLDDKARSLTGRIRPDLVAISKLKTFGYTSDSIVVPLVVDNFNPVHHTAALKLRKADDTIINPVLTTQTVDPTNPNRRTFRATFAPSPAIGQARVEVRMTTDTITNACFGENIAMYVN